MKTLTEDNFHIKSSDDICNITQILLDEIVSVFAVNCVTPWSINNISEDGIGCITAESFVNVARQLGFVFTSSESRAILRHFNDSEIDYIGIDYFIRLIDNKICIDNEIDIHLDDFRPLNNFFFEELKNCYNVLDWQKNGKLSVSDMKHMLSSLNDGEFDNNSLNALFKYSNVKNKRIVIQEDFIRLFQPIEDTSFFSLRLFDNRNNFALGLQTN